MPDKINKKMRKRKFIQILIIKQPTNQPKKERKKEISQKHLNKLVNIHLTHFLFNVLSRLAKKSKGTACRN